MKLDSSDFVENCKWLQEHEKELSMEEMITILAKAAALNHAIDTIRKKHEVGNQIDIIWRGVKDENDI